MKKILSFCTIFVSTLLLIIAFINLSSLLKFPTLINAQEALNFTEFNLPNSANSAAAITAGPDGNLWFTEQSSNGNEIGRITPSGVITEFFVPVKFSGLQDITAGPDGNLWFTEIGVNKIGRITPLGDITEFPIPASWSNPVGITGGPDGNVWFVERSTNKIARITPTGVVTDFPIPTSASLSYYITVGSDANLWFTEHFGNKIGRITPQGDIIEFQIPTENSRPFHITLGPDGNIWFTEFQGNKIGRITPSGVITEFPIPTSNSAPYGITAGPDGNIWFTEAGGRKIGRITPTGNITEYSIYPVTPQDITAGPDGNIWFTEAGTGKIARINLSNVVPPVTPTSVPTPTQIPTPTPPGTQLNVPYFSQNSLPWGPSEYDSSQSLGFSNYTMDRWGCAVTSVAMVLNYHNMKQLPDGTPIDPGSLNLWLKNNNGYVTGYGSDGSYSYLSWPAVGKLTKDLFAAGNAPYKLEFNPPNPNTGTTTLLNTDLTQGNQLAKIPNILFVNNNGHFVVAKGVLGNTYAINDPEWNYTTLASFSNTFSQVKRFVPSQTNLSYMTGVINPDTEILVTDPQGRRTGKIIRNGQVEIYNEIPNATYTYEPPINNPNSLDILERLGTGVNSFMLPKPDDGEYSFSVSSATDTNYTINVSTFEEDGDNLLNKSEGVITANNEGSFSVTYSRTQPSTIVKTVTFQNVIDDVNELYSLNIIIHKSAASNLIRNIEQAEKASSAGNTAKVEQNLDQFINVLNRERGRRITERAYQILFDDVESLKQQ